MSHDDLTPGSGHIRLTLNNAAPELTASLLMQDNWSGRAEIGLAGDDDLHLKVSGDGSTWRAAMVVDAATGEVSFPSGVAKGGLTDEQFGDGPLVTANYVASRGTGLFTNGLGLLGNAYPWPAPMTFDASVTPELPGAFVYRGRYPGAITANERIAVDPNRVYSVSAMVRQDEPPGDWSAYPNRGRHMQFIGMFSYDIDGNAILPLHHLRARVGGVDSKTVLTQPLGPGDTVAHVQSAAGWQDGVGLQANFYSLGIYEWRNSLGYRYSDYTRYVLTGAFAPSGVDKVDNRISLSMPLPEEMGNPDDPNGVWPGGTAVGGAQSGATFKYVAMSAVPPSDRWRRFGGYVGGVDRSGANQRWNFCPGTASISILVLPNYSLRSGGYGTYPDTGDQTAVRFAGFSVEAAPGAVHRPDAAGAGARDLFVMKGDPATGAVGYVLGHEWSADDV